MAEEKTYRVVTFQDANVRRSEDVIGTNLSHTIDGCRALIIFQGSTQVAAFQEWCSFTTVKAGT